eukprot:5783662-Prymnesium_polylepis.1
MLTPASSASPLSHIWIARRALWHATRAAEQATSIASQTPCSPSVYDSLPAANAWPVPVIAYAFECGSASRNSADMTPTKTPVLLSASSDRVQPAPCSASYPSSSSRRCCGSM